jgi:hypothetical protein
MANELYSHTQTNLPKGSNYTQSLSNPMLFPRQPPVESGWASTASYVNMGTRRMADLTSKTCEVSSHVWDYVEINYLPGPLAIFWVWPLPRRLTAWWRYRKEQCAMQKPSMSVTYVHNLYL